MLSARAIYDEIRNNPDTYALFLSIAADGEAQGGWENARIATLTGDPVLAAKIARHGTDEDKHSRLFTALLRKRGLEAVPIPAEANYTVLLEQAGIGLSHSRLQSDEPLSDVEILEYLVHSRVTEQRAAEEVATQKELFADDPELGKAVRMISSDEDKHLAYCHEELLRFAEAGHGDTIRQMLRDYARVEIGTYREVSLAVMGCMAERLGWPIWKAALMRLGIHGIYLFERAWGWRRMTRLRPPELVNALGETAPALP